MASHRIALVTDSTNDLPADLRLQYDVHVVPLYVIWGNSEWKDGLDVSPEQFYERMVSEPAVFPRTSQPSPQDFANIFGQLKEDGAEEIVTMTLSSAMSGTIQSARKAAESADIPVHVYDSRTNSMGLGWQILAAARARETQGSAQAMLEAADKARQHMVYMITLNTLDYLFKGGRIGGAISFVGNLLNIKPAISVNHNTGAVEAGLPTRTRRRAIDSIFENFFKKMDTSRPMHVAVLHNNAYAEAQQLLDRVREEFNPAELLTSIVSPILGVHTGPGALALCGYSE